jgi:NAD(P)-dependent dehydrogenase (short-subunit alcohol dehydrogenase family)
MDLELAGKRAVVTGASQGIGKAVTASLAAEGVGVVLAARTETDLDRAVEDIGGATPGATLVPVVTDTGSDDSVRQLVATAERELGGVDILVNAAAKAGGQEKPPALAEVTDDLFWTDVNVKVLGYLRCAREVAPLMTAQGWGRIINISGLAARRTGTIIGSMRNVAVVAMSKNLADSLGPLGVNVNVVHPGFTLTEKSNAFIDRRASELGVDRATVETELSKGSSIGRLIDAAEVALVVTFLASPKSVAVNGEVIACTNAPGPIHY